MENEMSRQRKLFITSAVVAVVAALGVFGTFAAFTATTTNTGNQISSGTVKIDQHAGATTLYNVSNAGGGASTSGCVRVAYTGSLAASVRVYASAGITNGSAFTLLVERGSGLTPSGNSCAGFTPASTLYTGTLGAFATSYATASGQSGKAAGAAWALNDTVDYRFTITNPDDPTPNARTTALASGAHSYTFEAQNN